MGNRAVITTAPFSPANVGIYLHWNGGMASIEGFLQACRELGYRSPDSDPAYAMARLVSVITAFFPEGLSVGLGTCDQLDCDNYDNGTYLIGGSWEIVGRLHNRGPEEINGDKVAQMSEAIVERLQAVVSMAKEQQERERA